MKELQNYELKDIFLYIDLSEVFNFDFGCELDLNFVGTVEYYFH